MVLFEKNPILDIHINNTRIRFSEDPSTFDAEKLTVIFLHDSLGCITLWRDFPRQVQELLSCQVLSYDRQGYGKSEGFNIKERDTNYLTNEAYFLGEILDHLQLKNVLLFGHSDGGSIALIAAALFPARIIGIVTEGAHVFVEKETLDGIKVAKHNYQTTNLKEKLTKYHGNHTEMVFKMWTETWLKPSFKNWNIENYLSKIVCPSLIIQGEKDEYGTIDQVTSIVSKTKGISEALMIPEIGHTPHKEATDAVLHALKKFVDHFIG